MYLKPDSTGVERFEHEQKDCTVRALANVLGAPYPLIHKVMKRAGRIDGRGVLMSQWHQVYTRLGLKLLGSYGTTKGARLAALKYNAPVNPGITLGKILPQLKQGRYVVKIDRHVLAVIDGKILDNGYNKAGSRVQSVYKLESQAVIFN
jgi:hypothetical protein